MGKIILRISVKKLVLFFLLNWLTFGLLIWLAGGSSIDLYLLLQFAAGASFVVTALTGIIIYIKLPQIKVDYNGIHIGAAGSHSIFYREIREMQIGQGAVKVISADRSITISNFYTNYDEAAEMLKNKIRDRDDIQVTRSEFPAGLKMSGDRNTEGEVEGEGVLRD